jgi:putative hydrolase of the HAD superfamily
MALINECDGFIFDYGGVLAHHQTDADQAKMAALAGVDAERFTACYWSDRDRYDKGAATSFEYWSGIGRCSGASLSEATIDQLIELDNASWMQFDSVMWEWVEQLRLAGKRVAMLSNMPRELGEALRSRTDRLTCFDQVSLSYEVHAIKPEPAIYEHCLSGLGTAPEKTLFLDDRIANVQGAELLGVRAIQFTSRDEVLLRVRNF